MVEVFKTNVSQNKQANFIIQELQLYFPDCLINFDLEDVDCILRIEGNRENFENIPNLLKEQGYQCELL